MKSTFLLAAIAVTTALMGGTVLARNDQAHRSETHMIKRHRVQLTPVMQVVPNLSQPTDASYGWQYFSDPRVVHAVVISPSGEYFLSQGNGPRQITGPAGQALVR